MQRMFPNLSREENVYVTRDEINTLLMVCRNYKVIKSLLQWALMLTVHTHDVRSSISRANALTGLLRTSSVSLRLCRGRTLRDARSHSNAITSLSWSRVGQTTWATIFHRINAHNEFSPLKSRSSGCCRTCRRTTFMSVRIC